MSMHAPHELAQAFAGDAAALRWLKRKSAHFARLAALRRERLHLLDGNAVMLEDAPTS